MIEASETVKDYIVNMKIAETFERASAAILHELPSEDPRQFLAIWAMKELLAERNYAQAAALSTKLEEVVGTVPLTFQAVLFDISALLLNIDDVYSVIWKETIEWGVKQIADQGLLLSTVAYPIIDASDYKTFGFGNTYFEALRASFEAKHVPIDDGDSVDSSSVATLFGLVQRMEEIIAVDFRKFGVHVDGAAEEVLRFFHEHNVLVVGYSQHSFTDLALKCLNLHESFTSVIEPFYGSNQTVPQQCHHAIVKQQKRDAKETVIFTRSGTDAIRMMQEYGLVIAVSVNEDDVKIPEPHVVIKSMAQARPLHVQHWYDRKQQFQQGES